jgi:hypothetical protein
MNEQEKKEFQALKERVIYLEGILLGMQGKLGVPPVYPTVSPNTFWYGPYPKYEVTC